MFVTFYVRVCDNSLPHTCSFPKQCNQIATIQCGTIVKGMASDMEVRRLRDKLVLASLVLIVPFVIWNVVQQFLQFRDAYLLSIHNNNDLAHHVAVAFTNRVHDLANIERTAGISLWGEHKIPRSASSDYLKTVADNFPSISYLSAADPSGFIYAGNGPQFIGLKQGYHPTVRKVIEGADWVLSDVFVHADGPENVFGTVVGIRDSRGRLQGMVLALMNEEDLIRALGPDLASSGLLVITDSKGIVALTHGGELASSQRDWSRLPFIKQALAGHPVVVNRLRMPDGRLVLGSVEPIRGLGWTASVWQSRQEVLGPVRRQAAMRTLIVLVLTGLAIGAALWLGNCLSKPVLDLAQTARRLGGGDLGVRAEVHTNDEVQYLAGTFNDMASTLQEQTAQLHQSLDTERLQSERVNELYSVAQGLITALELRERLEVIARALASVCDAGRSVILLTKGNRLEVVAGYGRLYEDSFRGTTIELMNGKQPGEAHLAGEPIIMPDVTNDPYINSDFAARLNIKGYLALPLLSHGHEIGVVFMDNPGDYPDFGPEAIETAQILADLAAIAIENAQVFERERNIAQALQKSLLPEVCDRFGKFRFACEYHAALHEAELGGDFYDIAPLPDGRLGIIVADVSGKGLEAAMSTAMGKYTVRAIISETPDPGKGLTRVNTSLTRMGSEWGFITMFYGLLDPETGGFSFSNAGHPPPVMVRQSGEVIVLPRLDCQPPLGAFAGVEYAQMESRLEVGDVLVCYTDGVLEAGRDYEPFEVDRLISVIAEFRDRSPAEISSEIYRAVASHARDVFRDDIALMVIKREDA